MIIDQLFIDDVIRGGCRQAELNFKEMINLVKTTLEGDFSEVVDDHR